MAGHGVERDVLEKKPSFFTKKGYDRKLSLRNGIKTRISKFTAFSLLKIL